MNRLASFIQGYRQWRKLVGEINDHLRVDKYVPEGVLDMDPRANRILDAAYELAQDSEQDDGEAICVILRLTGRHRRALRAAENNSRRHGYYLDLPVENRTFRLLNAALTGETASGPTEAERRRFVAVERFDSLEPDEAWRQLLREVPKLRELAALASTLPPYVSKDDDGRPVFSAERGEFDGNLVEEVRKLLGPGSDQSDPLLSSEFVRNVATDWLLTLHA